MVSKATNCMNLRISKYLNLGMLSFWRTLSLSFNYPSRTIGRSLSWSCFAYSSWWMFLSTHSSSQPLIILLTQMLSPPNLSFLFVNLLEFLYLLLMISIAIIPIMSFFLLLLIAISHILYPNNNHIIPYAHITSTLSWQFSNYEPQFYHQVVPFQ